jgi:hypothetical protein
MIDEPHNFPLKLDYYHLFEFIWNLFGKKEELKPSFITLLQNI